MLKDTKSLGNNKAPACESRGFVHKKRRCAFWHTFIYQSGCSYGRDIEGLFAFGFPDGRTGVSQSPDCGIIHHQHGSGLVVRPGYADDRFIYVGSQFLRNRNIAVRLFHIPTVLLVLPYVLSRQVSARVPPRCSAAPGFFFRSPAICPVRRDIRTDAFPAWWQVSLHAWPCNRRMTWIFQGSCILPPQSWGHEDSLWQTVLWRDFPMQKI